MSDRYFTDTTTAMPTHNASDVALHHVGMDNSGKEAALTVGYHLGNLFPKVSYAHGWDVNVNGDKMDHTDYDQIVVGADYSFSKRTTANAQASWMQEGLGRISSKDSPVTLDNGKAKTTSVGVGLKHVF